MFFRGVETTNQLLMYYSQVQIKRRCYLMLSSFLVEFGMLFSPFIPRKGLILPHFPRPMPSGALRDLAQLAMRLTQRKKRSLASVILPPILTQTYKTDISKRSWTKHGNLRGVEFDVTMFFFSFFFIVQSYLMTRSNDLSVFRRTFDGRHKRQRTALGAWMYSDVQPAHCYVQLMMEKPSMIDPLKRRCWTLEYLTPKSILIVGSRISSVINTPKIRKLVPKTTDDTIIYNHHVYVYYSILSYILSQCTHVYPNFHVDSPVPGEWYQRPDGVRWYTLIHLEPWKIGYITINTHI